MTRLKEEWIRDIETSIREYDREIAGKTGMTLIELAAMANDMHPDRMRKAAESYKVAAVPIKAGEGIIGQFSQSVAAILNHLGFKTIVTEATDVDGIYEAYQTGAHCLFLADDRRFVGINRLSDRISDNNIATAKGYLVALEQMAGGLAGNKVLVLGYGIVGKCLVNLLKEKGAYPVVYDINPDRTADLDPENVLTDKNLIKNYPLLIDATNTGGWLREEMLHPDFRMAAPGIPLSLDIELYNKYRNQVVHDWLQIGTAVMMGELCK
ncbi:MAG TPA: 3-methylornithyl-N6-L-lysine dehydrogenase PylD [Bacillota bacterium]|jgi:pyrrolysine biosynthesis protein PylD|nr:3-methylornithyl-N6-L-lysine dehydrogenase PylD [Clostridiales bacterium UBA9856]HOA42463.1 3-methylornithyl-N6-L-lysine dehydrogenase PylD [Bacillota bacterium]HPZ59012.1 3-methylornithyl-N6-L-lysine dehydrogenase PylD [Bacillota bacterium]HQC82693.1 3-methylornithyl-N6-L-lysine dehydrogenase PylD [Bacillota bacterium]